MSFYSALVLAANDGVRPPSPAVARSLLDELGLLDPANADAEFGNLAGDITGLFADEVARAGNDRFFCPDSIGFAPEIEINAPDGDFEGPGWCVQIHGNGYFFPWDAPVLRERVVRSPKLLQLRQSVGERFGGRFVFPKSDESLLRERWIDGEDGWMWFASESM